MKTILLLVTLISTHALLSQDQDTCKIYIPNTITMNCHTGEDWQLKCESNCKPKSFEISIFNRWGQKRYESTDFDEIWDAENESQGVYMYVLKVIWPDGREEKKNGSISVIK